ncbi:MAG TPA: UbiX family flavin prenyltransferase [Thermoplasmata archaeon]|nr:UbiX family flavin prenyltransferase [Thermoplasmata archaeon]
MVAVTGASGAPIAVRVVGALSDARAEFDLVVSAGGRAVLREEAGIEVEELGRKAAHLYSDSDLAAPIASGSVRTSGMAVVPCSMNQLARIATGLADNLIGRAAHVHLKERRPLVLVPRETPLDAIALSQMTRLTELGVIMLIASPPYYLHPRSVDDQTAYLAGKVLDHLHVPHSLYRPWKGSAP